MWWFIGGMVFGIVVMGVVMVRRLVGTLRVDSSDPDDGPYMFLELTKSAGEVSRKKYVLLEVNTQSYLSRN